MNKHALLRFQKNIELDIFTGCWLWTAQKNSDGYGKFFLKGKRVLAHRFSYEFYHSKIPTGLVIDHLCRNRECVNPSHLQTVTPKQNAERSRNNNREKTHCPVGHEYTVENTYIDPKKHRHCRTCMNLQCRIYYKKKGPTDVE